MAQPTSARDEIYELTKSMVEAGFLAFPLKAGDKRPFTPNGFKAANANLEMIATWIHNPGALNVGLVWPVGERIVFLWDIDGGDGHNTWRDDVRALIKRLGPLPPTLTDTTPSGGRHLIFEWNVSSYGAPPDGNHLLGFVARWPEKGYIVGPGSTVNGVVYTTNGLPIATFPEAWARAALEENGKALITVTGGGAVQLPVSVPEGGRYDAIRTLVAQLYNRGLGEDLIWPNVVELARRFSVPLTEPEVRDRFERTWRDIEKRLGEPRATPEAVAERAAVYAPSSFDDVISSELPNGAFPDEPDPIAFVGLAGEAVSNLAPQTSASRVGLLASILSIAGVVLATTTSFYGRQQSAFMTCLVGDSARGRKGTAMDTAWTTMTVASAFGPQEGVRLNGIGSGEGIVATTAKRAERQGYARVLVQEGELGSVLTIGKREGTTLSYVLRNAFDHQPLMNVTKSAGAIGVEPGYYCLGLLAGITPDELRSLISSVDLINGFANRILWVPVVGRPDDVEGRDPFLHEAITINLQYALADAEKNRYRRFELDADAMAELKAYYAILATVPGVAGRLTIRMATIAARIALIHASLDQDSATITHEHVRRAIALTEYCRAGIAWVFGAAATIGSADAKKVVQALATAGEPMTRSRLGEACWRKHWSADRLDEALELLRTAGIVEVVTGEAAGGRPPQLIALTPLLAISPRFSPPIHPVAPVLATPFTPSPNTQRVDDKVVYIETRKNAVEVNIDHEERGYKGGDKVWEKAGESPVLVGENSEAIWRWPCHWYTDHRFEHRLVNGQWECPICEPAS